MCVFSQSLGSLGSTCYVRWRLATSPSFFRDDADAKVRMLLDALMSVDAVLDSAESERRAKDDVSAQQVTLMDGELVGALTMKIVVGNSLIRMMIMEGKNAENVKKPLTLKKEIEDAMNRLFVIADRYILSESLPSCECGIHSGRAGYLKAIKFIQTELPDANFGRNVVRQILAQILEEGNNVGLGDILLWKWKQKVYLGALNGISGVLHTLLDFREDVEAIDANAYAKIVSTVLQMESYCLKSGNLAPSLKSNLPASPPKKYDKHIQFCSGAPGYVLLLLQMYRRSSDDNDRLLSKINGISRQHFLYKARGVAESVILPRGLLTKGVGLCHGISGNGLVLLSVYHAIQMPGSEPGDVTEEWLQYVYTYANFGKYEHLTSPMRSCVHRKLTTLRPVLLSCGVALDHLDELKSVPDRPYSLYEGLAGLVCLLISLVDHNKEKRSALPCFEF